MCWLGYSRINSALCTHILCNRQFFNWLFINCGQMRRFSMLACLGLMLPGRTRRLQTTSVYTADFLQLVCQIQEFGIYKVCVKVALYFVDMCRAHRVWTYCIIPYYMYSTDFILPLCTQYRSGTL